MYEREFPHIFSTVNVCQKDNWSNRQAARYRSCTFDISCRRLENLLEELVFFINAYVSPDADVMPQQGKKREGYFYVCA